MIYLPTGTQMRDADLHTIHEIGLPSLVLMERAALLVVEKLEEKVLNIIQKETAQILIVCGSGNNGGDGYAVARLLKLKGYSVEICFVGKETSRSEENLKQKEIADYYQIPIVEVESAKEKEYSVIVDAIFGTGLTREITGRYYDVISMLNEKGGIKVAVDIPSGVNDKNGTIMGIAFRADVTVAIAFIKRGLILHPGTQYTGEIVVGDIGITEDALLHNVDVSKETLTVGYDWQDLKKLYPKRKTNSHKGTYGRVLLIVGSKGMSGAAYLSAKAAYAVGAGLVQIYTSEDNRIILQQLLPEAIISTYETYDEEQLERLLKWASVVGIGSGLGMSETSEKLVKYTLEQVSCPCVMDADALNIISEHKDWFSNLKKEVIITPHMKEMARLLSCGIGELIAHKMEYLNDFVSNEKIICALKDSRTFVAKQGKEVYVNLSGNAAMAKAGSGDVLTGIISGILGQQVDLYEAACLGVYLHGLAGDEAKRKKGSYSVFASDLIDAISAVLKKLDERR